VAELGAKQGVCSTGNSLDCEPKDDEILKSNDASCKDMEAAAIAWSAGLCGVPVIGLKVITDIVDNERPAHEEFMENLGTAAKSLQAAMPKCIEFVVGKCVGEL